MKVQAWTVKVEEETHTVEVRSSRLTGSMIVRVDGDSYRLRGKPLGLGFPRQERCLVGMAPAILSVDRSGKANLKVGEGAEVKTQK